MMTDPIADMLTRIRNAVRVEKPFVDIPSSRFKRGIPSFGLIEESRGFGE